MKMRFSSARMTIGVLVTFGVFGAALASHSADLNGDGQVDQYDLEILRSQWRGTGSGDLNHNGIVTVGDAGILFSSWGMLPPPPPPPPGGWGPVVQLTTGGSDAWYYAAASGGTTVHMAQGIGSLIYRRSTDDGATWGPTVTLGEGSLYEEQPFVADGQNLYMVYFKNLRSITDWYGDRPVGDLFLRVSRNDGLTWQPEVQLTTAQSGFRVSMAVSGSTVHVAWMDFRSGRWDIFYLRSPDGGRTWGPEILLARGVFSVGAERPSIAAFGNTVHATWMDDRDSTGSCSIPGITLPDCTEIYYKRSLDNGTSWGPDLRLTTNGNRYASRPAIAAQSPSNIYVTYTKQQSNDTLNLFVLKSADTGATWGIPQLLRTNSGDSHPVIAAGPSSIHISWYSNDEIFYRRSTDVGMTWSPEENISAAPGESISPHIALSQRFVHVIWGDRRTGTLQVFYRRTQY